MPAFQEYLLEDGAALTSFMAPKSKNAYLHKE